jgi:hypothetical protein
VLKSGTATLEELVRIGAPAPEDKVLMAVRWLLDKGKILRINQLDYKWK